MQRSTQRSFNKGTFDWCPHASAPHTQACPKDDKACENTCGTCAPGLTMPFTSVLTVFPPSPYDIVSTQHGP